MTKTERTVPADFVDETVSGSTSSDVSILVYHYHAYGVVIFASYCAISVGVDAVLRYFRIGAAALAWFRFYVLFNTENGFPFLTLYVTFQKFG